MPLRLSPFDMLMIAEMFLVKAVEELKADNFELACYYVDQFRVFADEYKRSDEEDDGE